MHKTTWLHAPLSTSGIANSKGWHLAQPFECYRCSHIFLHTFSEIGCGIVTTPHRAQPRSFGYRAKLNLKHLATRSDAFKYGSHLIDRNTRAA